jgi:hypothetical protein
MRPNGVVVEAADGACPYFAEIRSFVQEPSPSPQVVGLPAVLR